jgi:hypothetical protein
VMSGRHGGQLPPTHWAESELDADRLRAIEAFRKERLEEPTEEFSERFAAAQAVMEDLLESTVDLTAVSDQALLILSNRATPVLRFHSMISRRSSIPIRSLRRRSETTQPSSSGS